MQGEAVLEGDPEDKSNQTSHSTTRHIPWRWIVAAGFLLAIVIVVGLVFSVRIGNQTDAVLAEVAQLTDERERMTLYRELAQYQVDGQVKIWTAIVQAVGAFVLAVGGFFAWQNLRAVQANVRVAQDNLRVGQENLRATEKKLDIDREAQITNRFTQAVTQLGAELKDGKPNIEVRLGGIYALERTARDSPRDHWSIMEVLTAYVRRNSPWPPPPEAGGEPAESDDPDYADPIPPTPRVDIQAILTVLGRRQIGDEWPEPNRLDLSWTDLRRISLVGANLDRAYLFEARFDGADMRSISLKGAQLLSARLVRATLNDAHLEEADLHEAVMKRTRLQKAHLEGANLSYAKLRGAFLEDAHLEGATLDDADLFRARFLRARLERVTLAGTLMDETRLTDAHLDGTNLMEAIRLTKEQVARSYDGGKGALLPYYLSDQYEEAPKQPEDGNE